VAKKRAERQTIKTDPAVTDWLANATRNRATLSGKQLYEQARIRIDVRANVGIKTALEQAAVDYNVSISQMATYLIGVGLTHIADADDPIHDDLNTCLTTSRSIRHSAAIDLQEITARVAKAFKLNGWHDRAGE
jgi:hypothetical protein